MTYIIDTKILLNLIDKPLSYPNTSKYELAFGKIVFDISIKVFI